MDSKELEDIPISNEPKAVETVPDIKNESIANDPKETVKSTSDTAKATKPIDMKSIEAKFATNPDPTLAAYATNFDITKLSNAKLNAIVATRCTTKTKYVKCGFCGKYDRLGAYNCSKCNTSLMNDTRMSNLLDNNNDENNDENKENKAPSYARTDEFLDCCDKCMNNFVYGCIYLSAMAVLFIFPLFEIINIAQHWNNYGGCSVHFQYLLLSKLLITIFLYLLIGIHIKFKKIKLNKAFIFCIGMILFFAWLIVASITFWGDDNFDHSHCNAHDEFTAGYYDFMYIEIMLVWTVFAFITSYFVWITISRHEKLIKGIVYTHATMTAVCIPSAMPLIEIIMLILFWDNHGHCSDKFEWYILVKVVFVLLVGTISAILFCYFKKSERDNDKIRGIVVNVIIGIVYAFLTVWGMAAAGMFFDKNAYDHHMCNHESMHTAIYYDWMFLEVILNFAILYLGGNVIVCFIFAGYLCGKKKVDLPDVPEVVETQKEVELQQV